MMIIGFSTVNVAPATTGSRTPMILPMPTDWMIDAMPETSRSALTRMRDVAAVEPDGRPDDQRHGHGAGVHDEQVLQPEDEQPRRRQHLVDRVDGALPSSAVQWSVTRRAVIVVLRGYGRRWASERAQVQASPASGASSASTVPSMSPYGRSAA